MLNSFINNIIRKKSKRLERFSNVPAEIQQEQLLKLLRQAKDTKIGVEFGFKDIHSIDEFRRKVPFHHYEEFKPYVDRIRKGELNVLWPTPVYWFAKSSGTTNDKSKFIPVTREGLTQSHYQGGRDVLSIYSTLFPHNKLFTGKCLTLGGSHQYDQDGKFRTGDLSAIMIQNLPFYYQGYRAPSRETALIANWDEKLEKLTKEVIHEKITSFAGVPSWNLILMKHILEVTKKTNMLEVWPNMELFIHGGVSFIPYINQFKKLFPSEQMHYIETYNASEGFFSIQNDLNDESMLLMLDYSTFYEFIPVENMNEPCPKSYHIGEVETDKNYAMVITSSNGLWRYIIGDTIKFKSLFPHKICITGRTKHFINAFGEELIIDNAEKAINEACKATGAIIHEYTAAPVFMSDTIKGAHEWVIEFEKHPNDLTRFAEILDQSLMSLNSDYEAKRYKNITIGNPVIKTVEKNTFFRWFQEKDKLGGQNKMPRLSNDRRYVEEILNIIN